MNNKKITSIVEDILQEVKVYGDRAVEKYTKKFDGFIPKPMQVSNKDLKTAIFSNEKMTFKESTLVATYANEVKILRHGQLNKSQIRKVIKSHGYSHKIK